MDYRPQSPDLSGFLSSPSKHQKVYQPQTSYAPCSPVIPSFDSAQDYPLQQLQHLNAYQHNQKFNADLGNSTEYNNRQYIPPIPPLPPSHSFPSATSAFQQQPQQYAQHQYPYIDGANDEHLPSPAMASRTARGRVKDEDAHTEPAPQYKDPNPNNIEIRTKFPVARIKRIMQADEEVGKVAQVTPVAVNKALELFMIALVTGAADKARQKGGKRVTAQHLKMVVEGDVQFDFLEPIVARVADVQEGAGGEGRKRKEKKDSESEEEEKKPKKGKGRRKKSDD